MDQKEQILHYHRVDGLSLREISRRVGLNRKTVTRYVREYEASIREDPEEGLDICLASKPKYPACNVECTRMTEPVCAEIEYWLQENAKRRQTGMRKQCLKKQDIHRVLIEKGFNISYSSVWTRRGQEFLCPFPSASRNFVIDEVTARSCAGGILCRFKSFSPQKAFLSRIFCNFADRIIKYYQKPNKEDEEADDHSGADMHFRHSDECTRHS